MEVPQPLKLLDLVRQAIRFRYLSRKTENSYLYYIRDFILFHQKRHPGAPRQKDEGRRGNLLWAKVLACRNGWVISAKC
ncbi:MAG: hypothetical protein EA366_02925 [Spirulina sp. DLM2.Bin59]|nr:MAG: hypothetical protein EA366_02925 [Spirulina sp. DLM2.Bin59]